MSFRHDDNIEEIDYVDDSVDDDTSGFAANEDESDWDCSTMEIVALTPNKIQFPDGALPEYTPMSRKKQQQQAKEQQQQPKAGTFQQSISNILFSFQSPPPEQSKTKKPMYGDDNAAGFSVDSNRTKTPLYAVAVRTTGESFSDSSTVDDSSRDSYGRSMNYFPSKYLDKPSPQLSSQRYPQQRQVVPASPSTSMRYSSSLQMQKQQQRSPFPQIPPSPAGSSQSSATFHSNYSQFSTDSRRQRSTMSYRSSTSMSLLHGEVINLEGSRILSDHSKYSASHTIIPDKIMPLQDIDDLEQGCLGPLEGLEIGGARSLSGLRSVPIVIGGGGGSSTRENRPTPLIALGIKSSKRLVSGIQHVQQLGRTTHKEIKKLGAATTAVTKRMLHYYRPPLSPRAQDLENLSYLQQAHKAKVGRLMENSLDLEDHYDFVLVLTPQEVYRYWADLLDFREEHLGVEGLVDPTIESSAYPITIESASTGSTDSTCDRSDPVVEEEEEARDFSTPLTGIYRRRGRTPSTKTLLQPHSEPRVSLATSLFSPEHPSTTKRLKSRLSMFEKAVGIIHSPNPTPRKLDDSEQEQDNFTPIQAKNNPTRPSTATTSVRRRWGNRTMNAQGGPNGSIANLFSPPVKSLTRGNASVVKTRVSSIPTAAKTTADALEDNTENCDPNRILKEEEIPNQVIPRGIAARTNGMLKFLSSLKRGIVVRRHRSNKDAVYCKIFSNDGGDTIQYQLVDTEEAMVAFKEQRVRYNRKVTHSSSPSSVRAISREWSCLDGPGDGSPVHKFKVPDHVAAQRYREKFSREHGVKKRLLDLATKAANSGMIRAADIVAVHPASHHDPRHPGVRKGELGTFTLRRSNSDQFTPNTFSIVTEVGQRFGGKAKTTGAAASDNKWYSGEGSELNFKTLDFEAATEGEYWLIFRGFLLLHRDAAVGRFAAKRKAGIGGGTLRNREDGEECDQLENQLQRDVFKEPVTVGCLERLVVKYRKLDDSYFKGEVLNSAVPPPSDYFLGFKSPGTQVSFRVLSICRSRLLRKNR